VVVPDLCGEYVTDAEVRGVERQDRDHGLSRRDGMFLRSGKSPQDATALDDIKKSCKSAVGNLSNRAMPGKKTAWTLKDMASDNIMQDQARK
jgi:hypothetical protein